MKVVNSKDYEERKLNPDDVVVLRRYSKGLIITDLYKETFCLSNKKYDTENIFSTLFIIFIIILLQVRIHSTSLPQKLWYT